MLIDSQSKELLLQHKNGLILIPKEHEFANNVKIVPVSNI